jgi:hypothetical protein
MNLFTSSVDNPAQASTNRKVFKFLSTVVLVLGIFIGAEILFPTAVAVVLNILWVIFLAVVIIFFALGILVIIGMRKEVSHILDVLLEGGLTIIDFIEFLKDLWRQFVQLLKEFSLFVAPILAYVFAFIIYIALMFLYKSVGKEPGSDVTILTIVLTVSLLLVTGFLNKPQDVEQMGLAWSKQFLKNFKGGFIDGFEVILFIFFLTMDSTNLFFFSNYPQLNVPLHATFFGFDLMVRSIDFANHFRFTTNLIEVAIVIEIIRNIMRIVVAAKKYYSLELTGYVEGQKVGRITALKNSIRKSFQSTKNDVMKFITYTTVLFSVFILFPKLKLLTLAVASLTNLLLDLIILKRLSSRGGTDLISRVLGTIFRF